jgi:hypothetical protein
VRPTPPVPGRSSIIQGRFQGQGPRLHQPPGAAATMLAKAAPGHVLQRKENAQAVPPGLLNLGGTGRPLPDDVRSSMEGFFGADFADVRVHVGPEAPSIGALAFTVGSKLYFAPGQYNPNSPQGLALLGHELTHVVQQRQGRVRNPFGGGLAIVQDPLLEAEADRMGQRAATRSFMRHPPAQCARPGCGHPAPAFALQMAPTKQSARKGGKGGKASGTARKKAPQSGGVKRSAHDRRKATMEVAKQLIIQHLIDQGQLKLAKQIHSSHLYTGIRLFKVKPTVMSSDRLLVRHIATTLLAQEAGMTEVQAAVNNSRKEIYIASNSMEITLASLVGDTLKDLFLPVLPGSAPARVTRHVNKLQNADFARYGDYKTIVVRGLNAQHAETKIVGQGYDFDYIGGTRRPCLACTLFFKAHEVHPAKYNPHNGAYWDSDAANLSYASLNKAMQEKYEQVVSDANVDFKNQYVNLGLSKQQYHNYDTDSDDDD